MFQISHDCLVRHFFYLGVNGSPQMYIYIYIYTERERERERDGWMKRMT